MGIKVAAMGLAGPAQWPALCRRSGSGCAAGSVMQTRFQVALAYAVSYTTGMQHAIDLLQAAQWQLQTLGCHQAA